MVAFKLYFTIFLRFFFKDATERRKVLIRTSTASVEAAKEHTEEGNQVTP